MSEAGGGGALENFDMQSRLAEILQTFGGEQTKETEKTGNKTTLPNQTDTTSKSDTSSGTTTSTIDPSNPSLVPPNIRKGGTGSFSGNGEGTASANPSSGILVPDGTPITEELQQLIDYSQQEPGVKALYHLVGDEKLALALLNEYFKNEGISTPVSPKHGKMVDAATYALTQFFTKAGVPGAAIKAEFVIAGTSAVKVIVNYFSGISSISPAGRTVNTAAGWRQLDSYAGSAQDLINQILAELESGAVVQEGYPDGILDYLKLIQSLVAEIRETLAELSFEDTEHSGKIGALIAKMSDMKRDEIGKKFDLMNEKLELQDSMQYIEKFMNVLNPIMGSTTIVVAMMMVPMNPLIGLLMLAVAISWFVVTTSLQQTGKMDDVFDWLNSLITGSLGKILERFGLSESVAEGWSKAIFWITLIVGLVALVALIGVVPFVGVLIPAIFMPMIMLVLSESGVVDLIMTEVEEITGMGEIWKAVLSGVAVMFVSVLVMGITEISGLIREGITLIIKLIVEGVIFVITLVIKIVFSILTGGVGGVLMAIIGVIEILAKVVTVVVNFLKPVLHVFKQIMEKVLKGIKMVTQKVTDLLLKIVEIIRRAMDVVKQVMQMMKEILNKLFDAMEKVSDKIEKLSEKLGKESIRKVLQKVQMIVKKIKQVLDQIRGQADAILIQIVGLIDGSARIGQMGVNAAVNVSLGGIQLKMAKVVEEEGELEYLIALLTGLIKALEALMAKLQGKHSGGTGDEFVDQIKSFSRIFEQLIQSMSGISEELAASAVV